MTPTEQRNQRLGEKMIQHLERRHFEAYYCETGEEAAQKVNELIPDGSSVTWGGTMTVRDLQIPQLLKERGTLDVWDRDLVETPEEKQITTCRLPMLSQKTASSLISMVMAIAWQPSLGVPSMSSS